MFSRLSTHRLWQAALVIALLVALAVACAAPKPNSTDAGFLTKNNQIKRYIDLDAGVVCWVFYSGYAGGISCLPLAQTTLRVPDK